MCRFAAKNIKVDFMDTALRFCCLYLYSIYSFTRFVHSIELFVGVFEVINKISKLAIIIFSKYNILKKHRKWIKVKRKKSRVSWINPCDLFSVSFKLWSQKLLENKPTEMLFVMIHILQNIYFSVGNIPYEATEEKLKDIFSEVGPVLSFKLVFDRETGKPKGYGFCEYKDQETALSAMRNLNGYEIGGRSLRVDNACTEKSRMEMQALMQGPQVNTNLFSEVLYSPN